MIADAPEMRAPRAGCLILAMVPTAVALVFLAYGVFAIFVYLGRPADGERVDVTLRACPEAAAPIEARLDAMGLSDARFDPAPDGFVVTVTLPADARVAATIPDTLAEAGRLEVRAAEDGAVLVRNEDLVRAGVRMDVMLRPSTFVVLGPEARARLDAHTRARPEGKLIYVYEGEEVWTELNRAEREPGELEFPPSGEDDADRMHVAARRGVVLDHPLPCDAELVSVRPAAQD